MLPQGDDRTVLPEKEMKRHGSARPDITVRTGEKPKCLLLAESEFFPTAIMKVLKGRLIYSYEHAWALSLQKCFWSTTMFLKSLSCVASPLSVFAGELLMVLGSWVHVLSQLAVAGLSLGELTVQKWRWQQALMLGGAVLLVSKLSRNPVFCQRLRCQKMMEKPNII